MYQYKLTFEFETTHTIKACKDCPAYIACNEADFDELNTSCSRLIVDVPEHLKCRIKAIIDDCKVAEEKKELVYQRVISEPELFDMSLLQVHDLVEKLK